LVLASASPRRRELLARIRPRFTVRPAAVEEHAGGPLTARETALLNAHRKARALSLPDCLVLGADTVVCLGETLLGKPPDRRVAREMLARLQGRAHRVITAVCLRHRRRERLFAETTWVTFRPLTAAQIARYLARVNPLDKAGAYAIQEHGGELVAELRGSFSNVMGLPLERLCAEWPVEWFEP
jgi:septum formation protein